MLFGDNLLIEHQLVSTRTKTNVVEVLECVADLVNP